MMRQRHRLRLVWDGPYPRAGQYLAGRAGDVVWLIAEVVTERAGGAVVLSLQRHGGPVPRGAVLHPPERAQPSDANGPARVRQLASGGARGVMRADWRDPLDTRPNAARAPRQISGWRTYCPLRRMASLPGSRISREQIAAADAFRAQIDLALIGRASRALSDAPGAPGFGPSGGPSEAAVLQAMASIEVRTVLARFAPSQRPMLAHVVLLNQSLKSWCVRHRRADGAGLDEHVEMGRLLGLLDILLDHYEPGLAAALAEAVD